MGWDASRPVPWRRLVKEYLIYAVIATVVLALVVRDDAVGVIAGVFAAGPIYLLFGALLAKLGYQRKTLAELRTPRAATATSATTDTAGARARHRPAPTRRTQPGANRPGGPARKRR